MPELMTKDEIIVALDEVIKDLEKPSTLKAPDGVFYHMLSVIKAARGGVISLLSAEEPLADVRKGKGSKSGT